MSKILRGFSIGLVIVLLWAGCGYFNYGYTLGYFTYRFPYQNHKTVSTVIAIAGPLGIFSTLSIMDGHWLLKPYTFEERWEIFHQIAPNLSFEYFQRYFK